MFKKIFVILLVLGGVATWLAWNNYQTYLETTINVPEEGYTYQLKPGSNLKTVAAELHKAGVLDKPKWLYWHARYKKQAANIKVGEYLLQPGLTPDTLLSLLASGKSIQYKITFVEGWTFKQFRQAMLKNTVLVNTLQEMTDEQVMGKLGFAGQHPEGRFFPDTYQFQRGETDLDILKRAYKRMSKVLSAAWEGRDENIPLKSAYEALILASIVEKETGAAHERPEIAGVFTRRLIKKMKLQTDPTVIYGMGDRFDGNIRRKDLREATPYNTYVIKALPPTPICMPGKHAIESAVHPKDGKSLYFVSKGDGTHYFSKTLKEHNAAVNKYILKK